jgi:pilus assembly protein CpaB
VARSILIVLLAVVCGSGAAVGVHQTLSKNRKTKEQVAEIKTVKVLTAARSISRGESLTKEDLKVVEWPEGLAPAGVYAKTNAAIGRVAVTSILEGEPIFESKLSEANGESFFSSLVRSGMRAFTIQTTGVSASVAGFVRPGDIVDVLLNLRGNAQDELGGGMTTVLLQRVEVLAIDQILDADADRIGMLVKGNKVASVTLLVTPEQATLLSLGQSRGDLSLAMRNATDTDETLPPPATIREILALRSPSKGEQDDQDGEGALENSKSPAIRRPDRQTTSREENAAPPKPRLSYIHTLRGNRTGRVPVRVLPQSNSPQED